MNVTAENSQRQDSSGSESPSQLVADDSWDLTQRIVTSELFSKSELLPKFLLHICDRELRGLTDELTEQQIGVQVFNRPLGYNPGDDNIVRNYAGQLRKRLDLYFAGEGAQERIRIRIPRGGYVPVFERLAPLPIAGDPASTVNSDSSSIATETQSNTSDAFPPETPIVTSALSPKATDWKAFLMGVGFSLILFCLYILWSSHHYSSLSGTQSAAHPLWSAMFKKDRDTFIVPADSGLGILQNLTERQTNLADYISGKYLTEISSASIDSSNLDDLRTQRYTSIADVNILAKLSRLPEVVPDRYVVRFARDLRMEDLQEDNAILLGAIHTDPWVDLLQKRLNFQFVCESHVNHCSIVNLRPSSNEQAIYENESQSPSHNTFGVVAFIPNLNHTGRILLVEGLNMAATQAAADTLLDDERMRPIIQRATLKDGSLAPFELLIETTSVDAAALPSRIVAMRFEH